MKNTNFWHKHSSFNPFVVSVTLISVLVLVACTLFAANGTQHILNTAKSLVFQNFSWFYIFSVSLFLIFLLFVALGGLGKIKLGSDEEKPEFSFMSWMAMLFAAGMGVGLMFFGVAEPLSHFNSSIVSGSLHERSQQAILHTAFHWGIHAWAVYGMIALALAYFGFRYKLPLALRSCFYPLLKDKINGKMGDVVDIVALIATLFGIITTLGFGSAQLGSGLVELGWIGENSFALQVGVIAVVMTLATLSAISGVGKGVKILSEINLLIAIALLLFVLCTAPTVHLLSAFSDNLGMYFSQLIPLSFRTYVYQPEQTEWFQGWTVLYWAWWCSWAPFVGLFIARISRGRTIREFVFGVLVIPSIFCILWFTVFGNSAIWLDTNVANGALSAATSAPEKLLFQFLDYLPLSGLTSVMALVSIALFFITSADSGIYVLNNIASRDKSLTAKRWQAAMWGVLMSAVAIVLLRSGGLATLQTMTLIVALPFAMLMLLMCVSLFTGLAADNKYFSTKFTPSATMWTGEKWRDRLSHMLSQAEEQDILRFLKKTALPAMYQLQNELVNQYGLHAQVNKRFNDDMPALELIIQKETMRDFVYGIRSVACEVSPHLVADERLPNIQKETDYVPTTYFSDGRVGYDVGYMSQNELIADMLKHYERYLSLLGDVGQDLMAHEQTELGE
ncbi:BCCT family transporter [Kingella kingae]|uniref:BCCT family transporter n=1 Tax=Kingella kingae TaxID=504 RepID=UPI00040423B3|nr:BCCT family transporter [Kingella kingae]MDK4563523.1 BCCT family transporter [Kingella kingae]MDK4577997.1 BCCT family transporter [Kingella kingae]MDK4608833.1 BCCT family transporter [Kingella kingae]MDK4626719.1 BCCT family transporter [Kingella kingae]MDK4674460.1 BCCT family transporter [Kingella kingae]